MANYLTGSYPVKDEALDANGLATAHMQEGCYAYLTSISVSTAYPTFYITQFDVFSDADKQTNISSISDTLIAVIADESDNDRELRALEVFRLNIARDMTIVSD